ncbi:MAG: calcium-translocating P-type ATPase, PMCA-type [Clostridia bacterium]|nr:calcium-translocating P-type ATPase, PMCA-type [Clostridia bacterium]
MEVVSVQSTLLKKINKEEAKLELFQKEAKEILKELASDQEKGLSSAEAAKRIEKYGKNMFTPPPKESIFAKIFDNLKEPLIIILMISGIISIIMGHIPDGLGIFAAVIIATTIAVIQEGRSDKAFEKLSQQSEEINVKTLRDGNTVYIHKSEITVGDIVFLEMGDKVPADCRIIQNMHLKVDESMLTGESEAVNKTDEVISKEEVVLAERKNMVYSGTLVVDGRAVAIVTSIGDDTEMGKIAKELKEAEDNETPLQQKLAALGKKISIVGSIAAAGIFLFELYHILTNKADINVFEGIKDAFVVSVALIVAAVPEGLPTMVALTLAFNMQKMAKNNALVRRMIACETIGSVNVICSDKTGTLTENKMTVVDVWCNGSKKEVSNIDCEEMLINFTVNSTADVYKEGNEYKFIGNPTEGALLVCAFKNNVDYKDKRKKICDPVCEYHFTSARKMMSTAYATPTGHRLYAKGSPEKILSLCKEVLYKGKVVPLDSTIKKEIEAEIAKLQEQAKRVLGFSYRDIGNDYNWEDVENLEKDMIFTGFVGIEDPLRGDVKDAINKCRRAGIAVKILTGDNINTARAIANQLGIVEKDSYVLEVTEIEKMSDAELKKKLEKIVVLARSNPAAKMRVVKLLREMNNSVVVTGDGINDAPALKSADVGVAMGIAGTEVSKESADIILLDDSFSTIVKAVKWGRGIYENFQRFIQFQLTVNVVAFTTAFLAEIFQFGMPFTTLQLLWVNIIMDGPPALSLGLEPPREHLLDKKPIVRNASIVTKDMLFRIVSNGLFIVAALLFLMQTDILGGTAEQSKTIVFTAFVLFQLWNAFNSREFGTTSVFKNIHRNKPMLGIILLTFFIQVLVVQFGGSVFKVVPLEAVLWLKIVGYTFSIIIFNEIVKFFIFIGKSLSGKKA